MFEMKDSIKTILSRDNNNILIGGGKLHTFDTLKIIIFVLLISTALFIFYMTEYFIQVKAKVINVYDAMNQCQVNVMYKIDDVIYHKNIVLPRTYGCSYNDEMILYYYKFNPNIIYLNTHNYSILSLILIILGILTIFSLSYFNH